MVRRGVLWLQAARKNSHERDDHAGVKRSLSLESERREAANAFRPSIFSTAGYGQVVETILTDSTVSS